MNMSEISSYELAYQIRHYLTSRKMAEEDFASRVDMPLYALTHFLQEGEPEPAVSQIGRICDVLSITMDSLVRGPVHEVQFVRLIKKCAFANKLQGTVLYTPYIRRLKRWREKSIGAECLNRYAQWFLYFCSVRKEHDPQNAKAVLGCLQSSVCFTRKISPKQRQQLEQLIEDSQKNDSDHPFHP